MQDAVPIRLGQEFSGYARAIQKMRLKLAEKTGSLDELGIGGSAAGTGVNTHPDYRGVIVSYLSQLTGFNLRPAENTFEAMQSMAPFTEFSARFEIWQLS